MDIHRRLRRLLEERGWTEYRLSKESGLSESTLANIFKRNASPSIPTLQAICEGFGMTLSQFFVESDVVELSPELKELFDHWVVLTKEQKKAILEVVKAFTNAK